MARVAFIHRRGSMNTATTKSTANGAARQAMVRVASTLLRASTATAPAPTSASGAAPPPTAPAASTAHRQAREVIPGDSPQLDDTIWGSRWSGEGDF